MYDKEKNIDSLYESILFQSLTPKEIRAILEVAHWQTVAQGQYVFRQDRNNKLFYIIALGEAELLQKAKDGRQFTVGYVCKGGHFGETALLTENCNGTSAKAITNLLLLCFEADAFDSVLLSTTGVQKRLLAALADRLYTSFQDHADSLTKQRDSLSSTARNLDQTFFEQSRSPKTTIQLSTEKSQQALLPNSTFARQIERATIRFQGKTAPILLAGESGTGRRLVAYEIHKTSAHKDGSYVEIDIRNTDPDELDGELFGALRDDSAAFPQINTFGLFNQLQGGTIVLYNAEYMEPDFQRELARIIKNNLNTDDPGGYKRLIRPRFILICQDAPQLQDGHTRLLAPLYKQVEKQLFRVSPLRDHRRDIPLLVQYYLRRYSLQYGKTIQHVDDQTIGMFMNYDWPGNVAEMASVIQRAVLLCPNHTPLNHHIMLGIPKSEGKWEYNLLRLSIIRAFFSSPLFPTVPKAVVGAFLVLILVALFFGPTVGEKNIGLTLSWIVGWPLLIFGFFFFSRTWCSVCGLSVPGWLAQRLIKPQRPTPQLIKNCSGWIVALLCISLFWIEIAWNACDSPRLTAWIILSITLCSLLFSIFYKRRVWCRYLCPLGAINALFSMPSVLELRSNRHVCTNRCTDHACYSGNEEVSGCPMFRHPFLVDNNRDCILCGQCIKNCKLNSIHLNLRLAPQELWNQQNPRLEDSLLVVCLAAIIIPFTVSQNYQEVNQTWMNILYHSKYLSGSVLSSSILFFSCIVFYLTSYAGLSLVMARLTGNSWRTTASILGYGMIPLVLGAFMAAHLEIFVRGIWLVFRNVQDLIGTSNSFNPQRILSLDATFILQFITIAGSLIASIFATQRIIKRLLHHYQHSLKTFALPTILLCLSAMLYLNLV